MMAGQKYIQQRRQQEMATKKTESTVAVAIPAIDARMASIKVVGDSPLIVHKWSEKAKREMLDKQMKVAKTKGHDAKDPVADFISSLYWLEGEPEEKTEAGFTRAVQKGARFGFPATGFKKAAVAAAYRSGVAKNMVALYGAFHIIGDLVKIIGTPHPREDMVKVQMSADIRYRGQFDEWSAVINVRYNDGAVSLPQLVNMFNLGGFACGVGEWRPEKGGSNGMFHVE